MLAFKIVDKNADNELSNLQTINTWINMMAKKMEDVTATMIDS